MQHTVLTVTCRREPLSAAEHPLPKPLDADGTGQAPLSLSLSLLHSLRRDL
jgi:hypothetical protein